MMRKLPVVLSTCWFLLLVSCQFGICLSYQQHVVVIGSLTSSSGRRLPSLCSTERSSRSRSSQAMAAPLAPALLQSQRERRGRPMAAAATTRCCAAAASESDSGGESNEVKEEQEVDLEFLKQELQAYLAKREEAGADDLAKAEVGKNFGGTKGNPILEYVSLAPNKGFTVEAAANPFDYSELQKYGYSRLATPIMKAGGRLAMYDLLGLEKPAIPKRKKKKSAPKLVIDRTGSDDKARYSGLKVGLLGDDDAIAAALEEAQRKAKEGESLRPRLLEEEFERPFADVRPRRPAGYWTAESIDEWGKRKGKSLSELQRARQDSIVLDENERLDLDLSQRAYSILTALAIAVGFGRSTPTFLAQTLGLFSSPQDGDLTEVLDVLKVPALALLLASIGSCVYCGLQAPGKKRNSILWAFKGLFGGPVAVGQLRQSPALLTGREVQELEGK